MRPGGVEDAGGDLIPLRAGFSLFVSSAGEAGEPYTGMDAQFGGPQGKPLAPATCGNLQCEPGEEAFCSADCTAPEDLPACGDATCDRQAGEGLLTCAQDCGPSSYVSPVPNAWCGNGTCDITESALTCGDCQAQVGSANPALVLCVERAGCFYSAASGDLTTAQLANLLGENETGGTAVVCTETSACQWTTSSPQDLDVQYGGDGTVQVVTSDLVPVAGTWVAYNLAGVMECPGFMTLDIPASPPESGELIVEGGGAALTLESSNPEMGVVPMVRMGEGVYHGVFEMTVEGDTLTIDYEQVFVTPSLAIGMIRGQMSAQGVNCTITRPFYAIAEGQGLPAQSGG